MARCACHNYDRRTGSHPLVQTLDNNIGELDYARTTKNVRHAGQLKLLCCEIQFLNRFRATCTVIYAGAAPGIHIPILAAMFPEKQFVLIDPSVSALRNHPPKIKILRQCMTEELAHKLALLYGCEILFISDVRTGPPANESDQDQQLRIQCNMSAQKQWHEILNPVASLFKFRLPWDLQPVTQYLDGDILLPIFGKHLTHETRLIAKSNAAVVAYNNAKYERQMAFFNRVLRVSTYDGGRCYDCTAYHKVIAEYLGIEDHTDPEVENRCKQIELELERLGRRWAKHKTTIKASGSSRPGLL
jgi:hypothetical protein